MAYEYYWLIEKRVLFGRQWDVQTLEEIRESFGKLIDFVKESESPFHYIADTRNLERMPLNLSELARLAGRLDTGKMGWVILIGERKRAITLFLKMLARVSGVHLEVLENMDRAIQFLNEHDPTIVWNETPK